MIEQKTCRTCGQTKSAHLFGWDWSMADGKRAECRACRRGAAGSKRRLALPLGMDAVDAITLDVLTDDARDLRRRRPQDFVIRRMVSELEEQPQDRWSADTLDLLYWLWERRARVKLNAQSVDALDDLNERLPIEALSTVRGRADKTFAFGHIEF